MYSQCHTSLLWLASGAAVQTVPISSKETHPILKWIRLKPNSHIIHIMKQKCWNATHQDENWETGFAQNCPVCEYTSTLGACLNCLCIIVHMQWWHCQQKNDTKGDNLMYKKLCLDLQCKTSQQHKIPQLRRKD